MIPTTETPFLTTSSVIPDRDGREQLIVVLKATFAIDPSGTLTTAEQQEPFITYDRLRGDPLKEGIQREGELMPPKPLGTDVFLVGHAVAPGPDTRRLLVRLRVGPLEKRALVFGERAWSSTISGKAVATEPEPFERVPLIYEHAFGGEDQSPENEEDWEREGRNPIGRGFRAAKTTTEWRDTLLPAIEDPEALITGIDDRPRPVGFAPIGRHWVPRLQHAGTYDEAWLRDRAPLLAADFDERFHHSVPGDQIVTGHVQGGEPVEIDGCTPEGALAFMLPRLLPVASIRERLGERALHPLKCDSVTIDSDRMRLALVYKVALPPDVRLPKVDDLSINLAEAPPCPPSFLPSPRAPRPASTPPPPAPLSAAASATSSSS